MQVVEFKRFRAAANWSFFRFFSLEIEFVEAFSLALNREDGYDSLVLRALKKPHSAENRRIRSGRRRELGKPCRRRVGPAFVFLKKP